MESSGNTEPVVIVTGSASGIGRGIALQFAERTDATVVVADVQRDPLENAYTDGEDDDTPTDELIDRTTGGSSTYIETDVSDPSNVKQTIETSAEKFGGIDVLVNNAGVHIRKNIHQMELEEWDAVIDINLSGTFYCSKYALPHLERSDGNIINISSVNATEGGSGPAYASSKAGITNLTRDLAVDLGPLGVNVNAICPGFIQTPITSSLDVESLEHAREQTLIQRLGTPDDIGSVAVFLASDRADFIHGHSLYVDGGWSVH
jgi:NAD(P)-dependent dehydrogenase (short-subunit alcohol dehydrogenase family)